MPSQNVHLALARVNAAERQPHCTSAGDSLSTWLPHAVLGGCSSEPAVLKQLLLCSDEEELLYSNLATCERLDKVFKQQMAALKGPPPALASFLSARPASLIQAVQGSVASHGMQQPMWSRLISAVPDQRLSASM